MASSSTLRPPSVFRSFTEASLCVLADDGRMQRQEWVALDHRARLPARIEAETRLIEKFLAQGYTPFPHGVSRLACEGCAACIPMRLPIDDFVPGKNHQRILKMNADLTIEVTRGSPEDVSSPECKILHAGYQAARFPQKQFFLYSHQDMNQYPGLTPYFMCVFEDQKLIGVRQLLVGRTASYGNSYFYDPSPDYKKRNLGHFMILKTLEALQEIKARGEWGLNALTHFYFGGWIAGTEKGLGYKRQYATPHAELFLDGAWRKFTKDELAAMPAQPFCAKPATPEIAV